VSVWTPSYVIVATPSGLSMIDWKAAVSEMFMDRPTQLALVGLSTNVRMCVTAEH
jgi:hypothetical protein